MPHGIEPARHLFVIFHNILYSFYRAQKVRFIDRLHSGGAQFEIILHSGIRPMRRYHNMNVVIPVIGQ